MIFCSKTITEEVPRPTSPYFTGFVDLTKAFDTICREGIWKIMANYGFPETFIAKVKAFHRGMLDRVLDEGESS